MNAFKSQKEMLSAQYSAAKASVGANEAVTGASSRWRATVKRAKNSVVTLEMEEVSMKRIFILIFIVLPGLFPHSWVMASSGILPMRHRDSFCATWTVVSSPNSGSSSNFLNAVAAIGTGDAWAVGSYGNGNGSSPLIEHWSNSQWSVISGPAISGALAGVAAIAANNIWAVGENDSSSVQQTLVEHWNGTQWSIVSSPNSGSLGSTLSAITFVSSQDIWATGGTTGASGNQPLMEHWNGATWSIVNVPAMSGQLHSVSAVGPHDVWAVGSYNIPNFTSTLIEHWDGTRWSIVSGPKPVDQINTLNSVVSISKNNVWAAGDYTNSPTPSAAFTPLLEHWNGTSWSVVSSLLQGTSDLVNGMAAITLNNITVVGDYRNSFDPQGPYSTLVERWNGTRWSVFSSPSPGSVDSDLVAAAGIPPTNHMWAVGSIYDGFTYQTLVEKC